MKATEIKLTYKRKSSGIKISSATSAYEILSNFWDKSTIDYCETFVVMYLSRSNEVLGFIKISDGGLNGCMVDIRKVFQGALLTNSSSIIVSHNHPSGNLNPSQQNIKITKELTKAGELLQIKLLDHLIVTSSGYFSFADKGII